MVKFISLANCGGAGSGPHECTLAGACVLVGRLYCARAPPPLPLPLPRKRRQQQQQHRRQPTLKSRAARPIPIACLSIHTAPRPLRWPTMKCVTCLLIKAVTWLIMIYIRAPPAPRAHLRADSFPIQLSCSSGRGEAGARLCPCLCPCPHPRLCLCACLAK